MADHRVDLVSEIVNNFLFITSQPNQQLDEYVLTALSICAASPTTRIHDESPYYNPLTTGSVAELHIRPMLSCIGDIDIMVHESTLLAIPAGTVPPTQLPGEFHSHVRVCEITDSEFPGYVYLVKSHLLTECTDDGKYNAVQCPRVYTSYSKERDAAAAAAATRVIRIHGPAFATQLASTFLSMADMVYCMRCLSWPVQAADWTSRHREYGWPDSGTVDCVVSNGCDAVNVAHSLCRQDEWMNTHQWRLSFSRAEIILLNSWMPVQQIVYHMLRVFVKSERLTDSAPVSYTHLTLPTILRV